MSHPENDRIREQFAEELEEIQDQLTYEYLQWPWNEKFIHELEIQRDELKEKIKEV